MLFTFPTLVSNTINKKGSESVKVVGVLSLEWREKSRLQVSLFHWPCPRAEESNFPVGILESFPTGFSLSNFLTFQLHP